MPFQRQPVLEGGRLTLRPLREDDREAFCTIAGDPALWALHPSHDRWQEPNLTAYFDAALARNGAFAIIDRASGHLIGSTQYGLEQAEFPGEIEIGWTFLARSEQGKGFNPEAKALMIGHALAYFERAVFQVGSENIPSRRAMAKIGAELTERTRVYERSGKSVTHVVYAFTREGFAKGPLAALWAKFR